MFSPIVFAYIGAYVLTHFSSPGHLGLGLPRPTNVKLPTDIGLYGVSMGSAAILRAIANNKVNPEAVILELPFARLLDAVRSRLRAIRFPTFPMAELMVFWGGIQQGFNGFAHNPVDYANQVRCPTLLLQGELDKWTATAEIARLLQNFHGFKQLVVFPNTGHSLLVTVDKDFWTRSVDEFLEAI